jgi:hypothetical protein
MRARKSDYRSFVLLAVLTATAGAVSAVTLPFEDGFENIAVGDYPDENGWQNMFSGVSAYVSNQVAHNGSRSFRLESYSTWSRTDYVPLPALPDRLSYEVSVYVDPVPGRSAWAGFPQAFGNMGPFYNFFAISNDNGSVGTVYFSGSGAGISLGQFTVGSWVTVRADLDFSNLTASLWLNGARVATGVPIRPRDFYDGYGHVVLNKWGVTEYNWSGGGTGVTYIDDAKVYEGARETTGPLPVPYEAQFNTKWCFLTSLAMAVDYYAPYQYGDHRVNKWDFARVLSLPGDAGWGVDPTDDLPHRVKALLDQTLGVNTPVDVQTWRPWFNSYESLIKYLADSISVGSPVVLSISEASHSVVVCGIDYKPGNVRGSSIFVNDPSGALLEKLNLPSEYPNIARQVSCKALESLYSIKGIVTTRMGFEHVDAPAGLLYLEDKDIEVKGLDNGTLHRVGWNQLDRGMSIVATETRIDEYGPYFTTADHLEINARVSNQWKDESKKFIIGASIVPLCLPGSGLEPDPVVVEFAGPACRQASWRIGFSPLEASQHGTPYAVLLWLETEDGAIVNECGIRGELQFRLKPISASIDIEPNVVNARSKMKWITCYIELPLGLNPAEIDLGTVVANGGAAELSPSAISDYDNDGVKELMVKFSKERLLEGNKVGTMTVLVCGRLLSGALFTGFDRIQVFQPGR